MTLPVRGSWAAPDLADGAALPAADGEGDRAALRCDEQVPGLPARAHELQPTERQQAARPGRRRAGCPEVGEVGGAAAIEARRDEADALHADVTPGREAVLRDNPCPAAAVEGENLAARPPGAMSWPAKRPNVRGATAIPPSTRGPAWRMTLERPRQFSAYSVMFSPNRAVTRRRYPNRPTASNAIPERKAPDGRSAKRRARPSRLILDECRRFPLPGRGHRRRFGGTSSRLRTADACGPVSM